MNKLSKLLLLLLSVVALAGCSAWLGTRLLQVESIGPAVAPDPAHYKDAVVQIYGADVWGFRGYFAIHTWVAIKEENASDYTLYQVVSWGLRRTGSAVSISAGRPDRDWFRSPAKLLYEAKGEPAAQMIPQIKEAVQTYPHGREYVMWPGPNSNSFVQWVVSKVPAIDVRLPAKAIGKNWMLENLL